MTDEERFNLIDIIKNDFSYKELPDEALRFVINYLLNSHAFSKVECLINEAKRIHGCTYCDPEYHEFVGMERQ